MGGDTTNQTRRRKQHDVLRYWRLIELFSPQQVEKPDPTSVRHPVVIWRPGQPLPWDTLPPAGYSGTKKQHPMVWQHTVYLGVYQLENIYKYLHSVFPSDEDAYDESRSGDSACAGLVIDDEGRLIRGSEALSSALWAIGRTTAPGLHNPTWIDGFDDAEITFGAHLTEFVADLKHKYNLLEDPHIDGGDLQTFLRIAQSTAGVAAIGDLATDEIRIASTKVRHDRVSDLPGYNFLNSFYLDDLGMVAASHFGAALDQYLTPKGDVPVGDRIDVRADPDVVVAGTHCDHIPDGRWLSDPNHPLSTSQQFAVNKALDSLGQSRGLMGVNGPPGTGKTTILRDLLAANVVRRAQVLATLTNPDEAFTDTEYCWKSGDYPRRIKQLRPDLTGYEMVVVSSNNAAVANVSDELPQQRQIHHSWHQDADYFADLASQIATTSLGNEDGVAPPSWGLIAARLGNSRNRAMFNSTFWHGTGDQSAPHNPQAGIVHGLQQMLKNWENAAESRPSWEGARAAFVAAQQRVDILIDETRSAALRLTRLNSIGGDLRHVRQLLHSLDQQCDAAKDKLAQSQSHCAYLNNATMSCATRRARHLDTRPTWFEALVTGGKATRTWRRDLSHFNDALTIAEEQERQFQALVAALENDAAALHTERDRTANTLAQLHDEKKRLASAVEADSDRFGSCYPGPQWRYDDTLRELNSAWQHPDLNRARADLFLAALQLHHAFLANATRIRQGLMGSLDVMLGTAPPDLDPSTRRAAWQLLFLVVPLISTTFASVGRMFHGLDRESLGWLLIDEAGQATPQAAVGAIWRFSRVLAVGDPMQLRPVVNIPRRAQHDLAARFSIPDTWIPSYTSVQQLADRIGRYGTTLTNGEKPTWVSAPLRVHRRCDSPMFDVSNAIAYENMMINGVHRSGNAIATFEQIPVSQWIDVANPIPGSHVQKAEIERLRIEIDGLVSAGLETRDIIAVSPFRKVAQELKRVADDYSGMTGGTIHTAQGREAPVVFLVLGGDPRNIGAKRWASKTPNLVNVAASRAQRRLYVIGDRNGWHEHPNFDVLASQLAGQK